MLTNKELPKTSKRLDLEQLPIDILLLTVKDCEFLACLSLLTGFSRMFQKELGDVYIGNIGEMNVAFFKFKNKEATIAAKCSNVESLIMD